MFFYLTFPHKDTSERNQLEYKMVKDPLAFEQRQCFDMPESLWKKYYKGKGPTIVICNDFIDIPQQYVTVVHGYWNLVDWFQKKGMVLC